MHSSGQSGGRVDAVLLKGEQSDVNREGGAATYHRNGIWSGDYALGATKVRCGALERMSGWQVGCASPLVGEVALEALAAVIGQVVAVEHDLKDFSADCTTGVTQGKVGTGSAGNGVPTGIGRATQCGSFLRAV